MSARFTLTGGDEHAGNLQVFNPFLFCFVAIYELSIKLHRRTEHHREVCDTVHAGPELNGEFT